MRQLKSFIKNHMSDFAEASGICRVISRDGGGVIFALHSVVRDSDGYLDQIIRIRERNLEIALDALRAYGVALVSLDEAIERASRAAGARFAVISFDDGHYDTFSGALPIMESYEAPFILYVTRGMIDGKMDAWWLALEAFIRDRPEISLPGTKLRIKCTDFEAKRHAFAQVSCYVHSNYSVLPALRSLLKSEGYVISQYVKRESLQLSDLRMLAKHRLVTLGSHGVSHVPLSSLPAAAVRWELENSRSFLREIAHHEIKHFAYPFGNRNSVGSREVDLVRNAGYTTAVTACHGLLSRDSFERRWQLPREVLTDFDTRSTVRCKSNGVYQKAITLFSPGLRLRGKV